MIKGVHAMFYSSAPQQTRAFLRDKLQLPCKDIGDGWLIFDFTTADMGVHPVEAGGKPPSGTHAVSFFCDDIEKTVAELKERGVEFTQEIEDQGFGLVTNFTMPGDIAITLYQPRYK